MSQPTDIERRILAELDKFDRGATPEQVVEAVRLPADQVSEALDQMWVDNRIALHDGRVWLPWMLGEAA